MFGRNLSGTEKINSSFACTSRKIFCLLKYVYKVVPFLSILAQLSVVCIVSSGYGCGRGKQAIKRTALIYLIFKMKGGWYWRAHEGACRKGGRFWKGMGISANTPNYVPNSSLFPFSHWPKRNCLNNFLSDCLRNCRNRQANRRVVGLGKFTVKILDTWRKC